MCALALQPDDGALRGPGRERRSDAAGGRERCQRALTAGPRVIAFTDRGSGLEVCRLLRRQLSGGLPGTGRPRLRRRLDGEPGGRETTGELDGATRAGATAF